MAITPKDLTPRQALSRSLQMVGQAAPRELKRLALLNLLTGTGPSVSLFLGKVVIDEVARLVDQGGITDPLAVMLANPRILWAVAIALGLNLVVDAVDAVGSSLFASLRDRVEGHVRGRVLEKVAFFNDIALFESPELLNLLELAEKGLDRIQRLAFIIAATFMGVFTFIPSVVVSGTIGWWVPLVLIASALPSIGVEIRHHRKSWRVEETQAGLTRKMGIYSKTITSPDYAKELRLFSLQGVLTDRWHGLFNDLFGRMEQVRREGALAVMLWSLLGGAGGGAALCLRGDGGDWWSAYPRGFGPVHGHHSATAPQPLHSDCPHRGYLRCLPGHGSDFSTVGFRTPVAAGDPTADHDGGC
ncbi:MAG: hypothetical protein VKJ09_07960 [Leptolyngbya sp.]|nr:hypothetical protein [Leptolyngbya sp.]